MARPGRFAKLKMRLDEWGGWYKKNVDGLGFKHETNFAAMIDTRDTADRRGSERRSNTKRPAQWSSQKSTQSNEIITPLYSPSWWCAEAHKAVVALNNRHFMDLVIFRHAFEQKDREIAKYLVYPSLIEAEKSNLLSSMEETDDEQEKKDLERRIVTIASLSNDEILILLERNRKKVKRTEAAIADDFTVIYSFMTGYLGMGLE